MTTRYNIIYADPPWDFKTYSKKGRTKLPKYSLMTNEDLINLPIKNIVADDAVLFMWVTWYALPIALDVIKAWGFMYSTCAFNWIKQNKKADSLFWGLGRWTRNNSEVCLLAKRGHPMKFKKSSKVHEVIMSKVEYHSKKPDETRNRIVELLGDLPRIELFARQQTPGWDVFGDQVKGSIKLNEI